MGIRKLSGIVVLVLVLAVAIWATELNWSLENQLAVFTDDKAVNNSSQFELSIKDEIGSFGQGKVVLEGNYNTLSSKTTIAIKEAILQMYFDKLELDLGYGYTSWGTADGINPTNVINPPQIGQELLSMAKEPVFRSQATLYNDHFVLSGVMVHEFVPVNIYGLHDYAQIPNLNPTPVERTIKNQEYALLVETRVASYDLKVSYFNGFDDWPEVAYTFLVNPLDGSLVEGSGNFISRYRKQQQVGLATAGVLGDVGVWAETAYIIPTAKDFVSDNPLRQFITISPTKPYMNTVLGADYTFFGKLYSSLQYLYLGSGSFIVPYKKPQEERKPLHGLLARMTYSLSSDIDLETTVVKDLTNKSTLFIPEAIYKPFANTAIKISGVISQGENGEIANSPNQVRVSISGSF